MNERWPALRLAACLILSSCVPDTHLYMAPDEGPKDAGDKGPPKGDEDASQVEKDASPPPAMEDSVDGLWSGLTEQGKLVSFRIFADSLTGFEAHYNFEKNVVLNGDAGVCTTTGAIRHTLANPLEMSSEGEFAAGPFASKDGTSLTTSITLDDPRNAFGNLTLTYSGKEGQPMCDEGTVNLPWTAKHVVCGDGVLDWPETCDDGDTTSGERCSEICQLPSTAEQEPNDTVDQANGPVTEDTVFSGAIEWDEVDVFAVTNMRPGLVAVAFELHGETIGMCLPEGNSGRPWLEVADETGNKLATNDDGSRMAFCPALMQMIPAGETIYVRVGANGGAFPSYQLHVSLQKR